MDINILFKKFMADSEFAQLYKKYLEEIKKECGLIESLEEPVKSTHHQMTYYNAKSALQDYILKYGRIDGLFELYYNFRLTPSEIKDILSYALNSKMIDEYQRDQVLNNLGIKD